MSSGGWEVAREEEVTRYDLPVDRVIANAFMMSLSHLLREYPLTMTVKAEEDANFLEAVRAEKIDPHVSVGREATIEAEESATGAFAVFRQYGEAAIADTKQVVGEVNFSGISPDHAEQVSALYVVSMQAAEPRLYLDKLIRISRDGENTSELLDLCEAFEKDESHNPSSDLVVITATIERIRKLGAFTLGT